MPYLGNGQYQITNNATGETKTVSSADLPSFGLSPVAEDQFGNNPNATVGGNGLSNAPMQINEGGQGTSSLLSETNSGLFPQTSSPNDIPEDQPQNGPDAMTPSILSSSSESFSPPAPPSNGSSKSPNELTGVESIAANALPLLGPEGMFAKLLLGAGGGLLTGLATGGDTEQVLADTIGGAAGMGLVGELARLIPSATKIKLAGKEISTAIASGDQSLDQTGNKTQILSQELEKAFGNPRNINTDLLPAATGNDKMNLAATLSHEITLMGGGNLSSLDLPTLQGLKQAYGAKGAYGDSNPTPSEKLYRNMSGAMGDIIKNYAPNYETANEHMQQAISEKAMDAALPTKIMQRLRTGMYAYYDSQALLDLMRRISGNTPTPTAQNPTLPFIMD